MRSLLKRPSTLPNPHLPWSKQTHYTRWYIRNYAFENYIEEPLKTIFMDDPAKAEKVFNEAKTLYNYLSTFYYNHYPDRRFYNTNYIYSHILKILRNQGTITALDEYNIIYGTPGMKLHQDNRTLKKWAKEYDDIVLKNLDKLTVDGNPLTSYFSLAPAGINLIKKTD